MAAEFRSYRNEAVVIKHQEWGEADRIVTLFTRQQGKINALAKGVRKIRSRRAGHLEPFTHVSLQLAKGKDMPIITQTETIESFPRLRDDLKRIGYASYAAELLDRFASFEEQNDRLFNEFLETLERLNRDDYDARLVVRYFEMRLLDLAGFRPQLNTCVKNDEPIQPKDQYFSAELGGALCPIHGPGVAGAHPIGKDTLRYLRHLQRSSFKDAGKAHPTEAQHTQMELVMQDYLTYILERGLNSVKFIRRVR